MGGVGPAGRTGERADPARGQPAGDGHGRAITLIAAGAILRFAVATISTHGLNLHVVGIILMLAGVLGLLVSLLVWGPLSRRRNRPAGYDGGAPLTERGFSQNQPLATSDGRFSQNQPPATGDGRFSQNQPLA